MSADGMADSDGVFEIISREFADLATRTDSIRNNDAKT